MAMTSMWSPVINGLHQGSLVEVCGIDETVSPALKNGQRGQLTEYDDGKFGVVLLQTGEYVQLDPAHVRACSDLQKPGQGGDENSFDIIIGPRTKRHILGDEVGSCLAEKGFCVVKSIQDTPDLRNAHEALKEAEACGQFGRLAKEVEEGYLGRCGRAKVMWLNPEGDDFAMPDAVWSNDYKMTSIAEALQPFCDDIVGSLVTERTPALVCLTMNDKEEELYMRPDVDDQGLLDFYNTWSRSLVRIVHFMGPEAGLVTLEPKIDAPLRDLQPEYRISASSGTIVIVREDTLNFMYDEPDVGESSWMQCFLLNPEPTWTLDKFEEGGLMQIFGKVNDGPPPPSERPVAVLAIAIQAAANMVECHKEWCAYMAGTDGQLEQPISRFDYTPYYTDEVDNVSPGKSYVKHFSVQEGIDLFDNKVFEISNSEAQALDPQNRQVLEVGCTCLHAIGMTKKKANQNPTHASISVGCDKNEWVNMSWVPSSVATNNQLAICANRFSYVFNMKGGSYVCDTACSSSLIAAHLGKVNLLEVRWDPLEFHLGLGTNLTLTVFSFIGSSASHMLSASGRCLTFNATASGYNRGDGTAGFLMKCGEWEEDRLAYFRGSQIGNDGKSASMSAPNGPAQEKCIWGAVREAAMTPPESTVWECHGTGTSLGDPIEVGAVRKVQIKMPRLEPLMIATSKSNIGHLEGGAAAVAMVKCIMVVLKTKCAPTIHLKTLNPHLDHAAFDAIFITEPNPYKYTRGHCQVSSFGVGGTNGHAIFWGEDLSPVLALDPQKLLLAKLYRQTPTLIADGPNPADWDFSGPDFRSKPGDKYVISIEKDPITGEVPIRWIKADPTADRPEFYSVTGNHNDWAEDRMIEGDVPNVHYSDVEIPDAGALEFRFLVEGDQSRALGPIEHNCTRRTTPMDDVKKDCTTSWLVNGEPGDVVRIELLAPPLSPPVVNWLKGK